MGLALVKHTENKTTLPSTETDVYFLKDELDKVIQTIKLREQDLDGVPQKTQDWSFTYSWEKWWSYLAKRYTHLRLVLNNNSLSSTKIFWFRCDNVNTMYSIMPEENYAENDCKELLNFFAQLASNVVTSYSMVQDRVDLSWIQDFKQSTIPSVELYHRFCRFVTSLTVNVTYPQKVWTRVSTTNWEVWLEQKSHKKWYFLDELKIIYRNISNPELCYAFYVSNGSSVHKILCLIGTLTEIVWDGKALFDLCKYLLSESHLEGKKLE